MVSFGFHSEEHRQQLKAVIKLAEEKGKLENEIGEQNAILAANNIGMDEPLVDAEGYPRTDIDVYKVRHARHRIICLKNDLKVLEGRIERGLWECFENDGSNCPVIAEGLRNARADEGNASSADDGVVNSDEQCFAEVGPVQLGSPADLAGLMENDKLLQFGSINRDNYTEVVQIRDVVSHSVGQPIEVRVKRGPHVVNVTLTPRPWAQAGLLGCEIRNPAQV